ncbi:MAG: excisionase [Tenericutes bacterium HGW-Tenericutes-5]|nr:MAG: excisionase [Tenericutes bacterium HGW-Tenericutes-5]
MLVITSLKLYTIEEISEILKVTTRTVYNYIKSGSLNALKMGKYWRVTEDALLEFIENAAKAAQSVQNN